MHVVPYMLRALPFNLAVVTFIHLFELNGLVFIAIGHPSGFPYILFYVLFVCSTRSIRFVVAFDFRF